MREDTIQIINHNVEPLKELFEDIDSRVHDKSASILQFGLGQELDLGLSLGRRGTLVAVGGVAGVGTTTLLLQMALGLARKSSSPVVWFSTSSHYAALIERLTVISAALTSWRTAIGDIRTNEWESISDAMGEIHSLPLRIDDSSPVSVAHIQSTAEQIKTSEGLQAVFIDTFHQMLPNPVNARYRKHEELSDIARDLVGMARALDCPVVATLSWPIAMGTWATPLHHGEAKELYMFGPLSADSDIAVLLEEQPSDAQTTPLIEARVLKNRRTGPYRFTLERAEESGAFRAALPTR